MNKQSMIVAAVVAVIVLAIGAFIMTQGAQSDTMMKDDTQKEQTEDAMMKDDAPGDAMMEGTEDSMMKDDSMMSDEQSYIPYTSTALADTADKRRVLFFYANWCPTCRPADADFEANKDTFPSDVSLIRVNYNDTETEQAEKDLAQQYGVTYQHTFVEIDAQGNKVQAWNGGQTPELLTHVQ